MSNNEEEEGEDRASDSSGEEPEQHMQEAAQQELADPRTHGERLSELVELGLAAGPFDEFDEDSPIIQSLLREEQENLEVRKINARNHYLAEFGRITAGRRQDIERQMLDGVRANAIRILLKPDWLILQYIEHEDTTADSMLFYGFEDKVKEYRRELGIDKEEEEDEEMVDEADGGGAKRAPEPQAGSGKKGAGPVERSTG